MILKRMSKGEERYQSRYGEWSTEVRFVGGLPEGCKLGDHSKRYYNRGWLDSLYRTVGGESSDSSCRYLSILVSEAAELMILCPNKKTKIIELMNTMIEGISRLADTYHSEGGREWTTSRLMEIRDRASELCKG